MDETTPLFGVPMQDDTSSFLSSPSGGYGTGSGVLDALASGMGSTSSAPAGTSLSPTIVPAGSTHAVPASQNNTYVEQDGKHKGVAGVARDILGTLGDFLLTRLHMPAMYWPAQKDRKVEAAMQGFDQDPLGAINRVTSVDYTAGTKLRDQFIDNQRLAAQQASTEESRKQRLALAQQAVDERTRARAGAMLNTMTAWDDAKRQAQYPALRAQVLRYGQANHLDLSNELPENYDGTALDSFIDTSVPVGTQRAQTLTARGQDLHNKANIRNNDTLTKIAGMRNDTTIRGQDLAHGDRVMSDDTRRDIATQTDTTRRDIASQTNTTRLRGQDLRQGASQQHDATIRRGQDMRVRPPQEGERRTIGGKVYVWHNGKAELAQ